MRSAPATAIVTAGDVGEIERNAGLLFGLLGGGLWSYPTFKLLAGEAWRRGPRGLAAFLGEALTPARGWLESAYQSETSRALWAPWVLHAGLGPEDAFSGQIAKVIAFALEAAGAPIVKGGAQNLLAAFEALIKERGGEIRTGADVASIVQANGRATGVRLASGETISAEQERHLLGHADAALRAAARRREAGRAIPRRCKKYRYGKGNFQIHYALDKPPAWRGEGLGKVALLHLTPGLDGVSKACNEAARGMLPEVPTICVGQPHALDPSRCPEGKAILWLQLPEAPRHIKGDAAGKLARAGRRQMDRGAARSLCRSRRGDPRQPYRRLQGQRHCAARLFAGRSRGDEHQSGRRRSLWRLVDHRPVVPVAAVQGQPSTTRPRSRASTISAPRRIRARASPAAPAFFWRRGCDGPEGTGKAPAHLDPRPDRAAAIRALSDEPHHGPLQRHACATICASRA